MAVHSKVCSKCDFRTLNLDAKKCPRCAASFVAKEEKEEDVPPIAKATGKAAAKSKSKE